MKSFCCAFFALCFLCAALPAFPSETSYEGLTIKQLILKDDLGNNLAGKGQIDELVGIKAGAPFSGAAIRKSLSLLYLKGTYRDIRVEAIPENGGVRLEYTFELITVVDKVVVRGTSAVSTSTITEALPTIAGRELRQNKLSDFRTDIATLYQAQGYYDAVVSFHVVPLKDPHHVELQIDIAEGAPTLIAEISFEGNKVFTNKELLAVMKSRVGKPVRRDLLLDTDMEAIVKKYAAAGYPAAKAGPVNMSFRNNKAYISVLGSEGQHVSVKFTGNHEFSSRKLGKTLLIWSEHDISDAVIDSSTDKIKSMYREQGYADIAVEVKKTEAPGSLDLDISITEGPRIVVDAIVLRGNTVFPSPEIKKQMALKESGWFRSRPFREDLLDKDVDNLRDRYLEAGYLSVAVKKNVARSADGTEALVTIDITEGAQTKTGAVVFEGNTVFTAAELMDKVNLKPGTPFNERILDEDKYRILSAYSGKGYLYARVDAEKTSAGSSVGIRYRITEDQPVHIGRIILRGNIRTKDYVIMRELLVKPGDAYDYGAILSSQQRIYHLGYFRLAKIEPVHPGYREPTEDMLLTVEERPAGMGEFGFGYGDLDRLRGSAEVGYRNLWGTAEYTSVRYEQSDILKRAIFNYKKPWFLNRRIESTFSLVWSDSEKLNSDTREIYYKSRKTAASFGIQKTYGKLTPSITYEFENVVNYDVLEAAQITTEDSGRVLVSSLSPALILDLRDDVFNPRRGSLYGIILKEALRELWSQAEFTKLSVQGSWFLPVGDNVIALSARGGAAWPYGGTAEVPLHERFYVGGSTTVRGFTQDSIGPSALDANGNPVPQGGASMVVLNAEFRVNPGEGLGFVLFTDAGNVWPGQEMNLNSLRASYGAGIRYGTPIGPLRIDYGQKFHQLPGESPGELHFNIGNTF